MFAKINHVRCALHKYDFYSTLNDAIFACAGDERCEKVEPRNCEDNYYTLCPGNSTEVRSLFSCIYKKLGKYGIDFS